MNGGKQAPGWSLKTRSLCYKEPPPAVLSSSTQPQRSGKEKNADSFFPWASKILWLAERCLQAETSGSQGTNSTSLSPTPSTRSPPATGSRSKALNLSSFQLLSRMHLWPGGNPDYTFKGTSCFLNQEQRLRNDNIEDHSNTIGHY